jgi:hypothetical protein
MDIRLAVFLVVSFAASSAFGHDAPATLAETGLYEAGGAVDSRHLPFAPQYPLWTDGAHKSRFISLPAGARIDAADVDAWRFPAGTKVWKEFAWKGRKVETRFLWKPTEDTWVYATYVWSEDQTEARLAPADGIQDAYEIAPGKWHSIPSLSDCTACHASAPAPVLGFGALQLSDDRDPLAPHAEPLPRGAATLRSLSAAGLLDPPLLELVRDPPRIRERDPKARAVLGYLSANCGGCHNRSGPLARLGFDLLHTLGDARARTTAVDAPTRFVAPGVPPEHMRVVAPGAPEHSALFFRMRSRRPSSQMPPLGSVLPDKSAAELVREWIASLAPSDDDKR